MGPGKAGEKCNSLYPNGSNLVESREHFKSPLPTGPTVIFVPGGTLSGGNTTTTPSSVPTCKETHQCTRGHLNIWRTSAGQGNGGGSGGRVPLCHSPSTEQSWQLLAASASQTR